MIAPVRALTLGGLDLLRPRVFGVLVLGAALTLALILGLQVAVFVALRLWGPSTVTLPWIGGVDLGNSLSWASLALLPVMSLFLAAPAAAAFAGLFSERVADSVEQAHGYPQGQGLDFAEGLMDAALIMGAVIIVTLAVMILTPVVGPLAPLVLYGANGWLLGREFFAMAARRHLDRPAADALRQGRTGSVTALGVLTALLLTVPLVNIVVPVLAAAAFTHLFHDLRRGARTRSSRRA